MFASNKKEPSRINHEKYPLHQAINIFLSSYFKYLILGVFLLVLVFAYFFLLKPRYDEIMSEADNTQNIQEEEYNILALHHSGLLKYIREYKNIKKQDMEKIKKMVPSDYSEEQLFTDFSYLINSQGFILNSINISDGSGGNSAVKNNAPQEAGGSTGLGRINLKADISGINYESLLNLLDAIENNLRIMDINSLAWQPDSLNLILDITTYYLK